MKFIVPIYTADIEVMIAKPSINHNAPDAEIEFFTLKNTVVKGFNISDIKDRMHRQLEQRCNKIKKLGKDQVFRFREIHLLRQHGYGIND